MQSSLPALKQRRAAKSALAGGVLSMSADINPQHLKREVNRIYPRLEAIDQEINAIRQQLPPNLNQIVQQLRSDIDKLNGIQTQNPEINEPDSNSLLQKKLEDLESRLQMQLEVSLEQSNHELDNKLKEINRSKSKEMASFKIDDGEESSFDERLKALQQTVDIQQKKTLSRIQNIKDTIAKLTNSSPNGEESYKQLTSLNEEINANRKNISELRTRLSEIKIQLERQNVREQIQQYQLKAPKAKAKGKVDVMDVPDLTEPIEELRNDVANIKQKYSNKIKEMKDKAAECEAKVKKVDQMAVEIVTSTATLESRITEVDSICKTLIEQVKALEERAGKDDNQQLVKDLTQRVLDEHKALRDQLEALKTRALKCQESIRRSNGE